MMICKAANTSIKSAFSACLGLDMRLDLVLPTPTKHDAGRLRLKGYRVVTVVREPAARIASCWQDKVRDRFHKPFERKYGAAAIHAGTTFGQFIKFVHRTPDGVADQHFRSMTWDLYHDDFGLVPDTVLKVEDPEWWEKLREIAKSRRLDIGPRRQENQSRVDARPAQWTDELAALVRERYADDFASFYP